MPEQGPVYSNAHSIEQLGQAFQNIASENVTISRRDCADVPDFIRRLQAAQEATRNHNIQFG